MHPLKGTATGQNFGGAGLTHSGGVYSDYKPKPITEAIWKSKFMKVGTDS